MMIVSILAQVLFVLLIAYVAVRFFKKASVNSDIKEKKFDMKLQSDAYKNVAADVSDENIEQVNRDREGLEKFNSL